MARYFDGDAGGRRAPRRHGREVHRRRGHGRLRRPRRPRGRRPAGGPGGRARCARRSATLNDELRERAGSRLGAADRRQHRRGRRRRPAAGELVRDRRRGQRGRPPGAGRAARRDPARRGDLRAWSATRSRSSRRAARRSRARRSRCRPSGCWRCARGAPAARRRLDAPLVGRERSCAAPGEAFERARSASGLPAVTVARRRRRGQVPAGRRVRSAGSRRRPMVLRGRCLPYGEGITFWPSPRCVRRRPRDRARTTRRRGRTSQAGRPARRRRADGDAGRRADRRRSSALEADAGRRRGDLLGGPPLLEALAARAAAGRGLRRPPLGRADPPRPHRARSPTGRATRRSCWSPWPGPSCSSTRPAWGGGKLNATTHRCSSRCAAGRKRAR